MGLNKEVKQNEGTKNPNQKIFGLDDIVCDKSNHGYNPEYGLLGSNVSTDNVLKLFPRNCDFYVDEIQKTFKNKTINHYTYLLIGIYSA